MFAQSFWRHLSKRCNILRPFETHRHLHGRTMELYQIGSDRLSVVELSIAEPIKRRPVAPMMSLPVVQVAPFPQQIRLENTNVCNAACVMCPRELQSRKRGYMKPELLDRILEQCRGHKISKFTIQGFGEPLLDKNFCSYVRKVKDALGCRTFTVSNGSIITPELANQLATCGLDKIKISFYGTNKREYEEIHTHLKYETTRQGILNLVAAKRAHKSKIVIRVQYIGRLWKFVPFALQWMTKAHIGYNTLHNYGRGRLYNRLRGYGGRCPMHRQNILQVLWNGDVVPCCYDFNGDMVLGNLYEQSIETIWQGRHYNHVRCADACCDYSDYPICQKCDKRY
jgi:MoaA/NifB/PqqE/SkfB family radical SAM enzyme